MKSGNGKKLKASLQVLIISSSDTMLRGGTGARPASASKQDAIMLTFQSDNMHDGEIGAIGGRGKNVEAR